jgi:hypothetical protein
LQAGTTSKPLTEYSSVEDYDSFLNALAVPDAFSVMLLPRIWGKYSDRVLLLPAVDVTSPHSGQTLGCPRMRSHGETLQGSA